MSSTLPGTTFVLLFDGTGNFFREETTNIIRLFEAPENDDAEKQLLYYQPGVGTYVSPSTLWASTFCSIAKWTDKAVACFLSDHIIKGYRFLKQHHRKGDRICLFGFSRGAYTARALAGMLYKVGLLPMGNEEHLPFAWKCYKDSTKAGVNRAQGFKATFSRNVQISFVGVWDTVGSVGLFGRHLGFTRSNPGIRTFRHAVALDERRRRFQPNLCGDGDAAWSLLNAQLGRKKAQEYSESLETLAITRSRRNSTSDAFTRGRRNSIAIPPSRAGSIHAVTEEPEVGQTLSPTSNLTRHPSLRRRPSGTGATFGHLSAPREALQRSRSFSDLPRLNSVFTSQESPNEKAVPEPDSSSDEHSRTEAYKEVWFAGCHSDVGGSVDGTALDDVFDGDEEGPKNPNLANISLGWMMKEAIATKAGLSFRRDAFSGCPGVLAAIGKAACNRANINTPQLREPERLILELAGALGFSDVSGEPPEKQADVLYAKWSAAQAGSHAKEKQTEKLHDDKVKKLKEGVFVRDACADTRDQLETSRGWLLLEWLPLWEKRVRPDGSKSSGFRWNRGRGRVIPTQEVLFHSSVLVRQCVQRDYKPRATLKSNQEPRYVH